MDGGTREERRCSYVLNTMAPSIRLFILARQGRELEGSLRPADAAEFTVGQRRPELSMNHHPVA